MNPVVEQFNQLPSNRIHRINITVSDFIDIDESYRHCDVNLDSGAKLNLLQRCKIDNIHNVLDSIVQNIAARYEGNGLEFYASSINVNKLYRQVGIIHNKTTSKMAGIDIRIKDTTSEYRLTSTSGVYYVSRFKFDEIRFNKRNFETPNELIYYILNKNIIII